MGITRIIQKINGPWLITPLAHGSIRSQLEAYQIHGAYNSEKKSKEQKEEERRAMLCATSGFAIQESRANIPYNIDSNGIAQIYISGVIGKGLSTLETECGGVCCDQVSKALAHIAEHKPVALAMHYNSPGGTVTGTPEAAALIKSFSQNIAPVHAYTDTLCASAAYWMAVQSDDFHAAPSASIGSIGVYCSIFDTSEAYTKQGVDVTLVSSGVIKGQGSAGVPVNDEYKSFVAEQCNIIAQDFFSTVITERKEQLIAAAKAAGVDADEYVASIFQGQCWMAKSAPGGLIDSATIQSREDHLRMIYATYIG